MLRVASLSASAYGAPPPPLAYTALLRSIGDGSERGEEHHPVPGDGPRRSLVGVPAPFLLFGLRGVKLAAGFQRTLRLGVPIGDYDRTPDGPVEPPYA